MKHNIVDIINVALNVSKYIATNIENISNEDICTKSLNSLVSYVDITAEKMLVEGLSKILPNADFLTEENTISNKRSSEFLWVIDPLDGTTNFLHKIPYFGISIALLHKNITIEGVVVEINRGEVFHASLNNGAYLNNKQIINTYDTSLSNSLISTGFPYFDFTYNDAYLSTLKYLMQHTRGIRRCGAASIDLCYTALGKFDAFFEYNLSPWDVAAGGLIAKEAGCIVSDFFGNNNWIYGKEIIAANSSIYNEFINLISKNFKTS